MSDLPLTIEEATRWLRNGKITSVALTKALLKRSHLYNDAVGAFITFTDEQALAAARQADTNFETGVDLGPLQGIPIGIKDIIATEDAPSTANSKVLAKEWGQREDATVVRKLRAAGAVILGKLSLNEFAIGWPDPDTGFKVPRNPWNLAHSPGGSSSGTGAAVALGMILGGLGTDTGGSIRFPAAFCGISGLKATYGRVSKEGCVPLGYSLDHIGPMTRSVYDCTLMLQVLAGYDDRDPTSLNIPVPDMVAELDGSVAGLTIGLPSVYFEAKSIQKEVKEAVMAAVHQLEAAGAKVIEVDLPFPEEVGIAHLVTMLSEAFAYHEPDLQTVPEIYGKYTRTIIRQAVLYSGADYVQSQRVRSVVKAKLAELMQPLDVLIMPTTADTALAFDRFEQVRNHEQEEEDYGFCSYFNFTGNPALSIPVGFSKNNCNYSARYN